jgi:hypothetical protein
VTASAERLGDHALTDTKDPAELRRLTTHHGTQLYVETSTGELRHGERFAVPDNVRLYRRGGTADLVRWTGEQALPIGAFEILDQDRTFSLKAGDLFVSAEPDGRVTLSRAEANEWERFTATGGPWRPFKVAVFTTAYNQGLFLPLWLKYYGQQFGAENLYVLDHGSTDGSTFNIHPASVVKIPRFDPFDEYQRSSVVSNFQQSLLCYYDAVIFADPDEFLVPRPSKFATLSEFIERRCETYVSAVGVEVVHLVDDEPDMDLASPLLPQRRYAQFTYDYCKTIVSRVPLRWLPGFHASSVAPKVDPDLYLFHMKRMDYAIALRSLGRDKSVEWAKSALVRGHGTQQRASDDEFTRKYFNLTAEKLNGVQLSDFDFAADLARLPTEPWQAWYGAYGAVAEIPAEFKTAKLPLGGVTEAL